MSDYRCRHLIRKALTQIGFSGSFDEVIHQFEEYHDLILKWNQKMNLVSKRDIENLIAKHFLPSIGWMQKIRIPEETRIVDVGSGAGFPGIPVKLIRPDIHMILVDSKRKKTLFLQQAIVKLGLQSIEVINERVEKLEGKINSIDMFVCRAVSDLLTLMGWIQHITVTDGGKLVALKGRDVRLEVESLEKNKEDFKIKRIEVLEYCPFPTLVSLNKGSLVVVSL